VRESRATLVASAFALAGTAITVGVASAEGHLAGDLLALSMASCIAVMMLIIRRHRQTSMLPAVCLSAALCPLLVWPFAAPFSVGGRDLLALILFGTNQFGLGWCSWRWAGAGCRRPNTSKPAPGHKIYPYLLRNLAVTRPNQVWAMDITYIPMKRGFVYLAVVVDWFSRRVLA
jgi:hypothetical protein